MHRQRDQEKSRTAPLPTRDPHPHPARSHRPRPNRTPHAPTPTRPPTPAPREPGRARTDHPPTVRDHARTAPTPPPAPPPTTDRQPQRQPENSHRRPRSRTNRAPTAPEQRFELPTHGVGRTTPPTRTSVRLGKTTHPAPYFFFSVGSPDFRGAVGQGAGGRASCRFRTRLRWRIVCLQRSLLSAVRGVARRTLGR